MNKIINRILHILLVITLVANSIPFTIVTADENAFSTNNNEKGVIRIGYTENYSVIKTPTVAGFEGYGYEYFRQMEEYIDYEFEFVLCDWSDTTDMLRTGELDIVASVNKTEERLEEFYFTQNIFAKEMIFLLSNDNIYFDESSYSALNKANIGVRQNSSLIVNLEEFIDKNNLSPNIEFIEISNYANTLNEGYFDYLLNSSLQMETNLNVALNLGTKPNYIMGTSQELIDEIDYAMTKIEEIDYMFKEDLHNKYFNRNIGSNVLITDEEYELIKSSSYDVGVVNMYTTYGYTNEKEIDNVSVDVLRFITELLGININYIEITADSTKEEFDELDFYIYLNGYDTDLYENHSILIWKIIFY